MQGDIWPEDQTHNLPVNFAMIKEKLDNEHMEQSGL